MRGGHWSLMVGALLAAPPGLAQPGPESEFINRYVLAYHVDLEPILHEHFVAHGVAAHELRSAVQDTVMSEAECSLDATHSYGDGYQDLLLKEIDAGANISDARYAVLDTLERDLASAGYPPGELEERLLGSHVRFDRCLAERMRANGLPPLPARTEVPR